MPSGHRIPCQALLFDCDGVLVDSVDAGIRGWSRWAEEYGLDPATVTEVIHGRRSAETAAYFLGHLAPDELARAVARIDEIEAADAVHTTPIPGAPGLLDALGGSRWAVATSASTVLVSARLAGAALPTPPVLVTADSVAHGKPAPDCYLTAAAKLGVAPAHAVVFEDTAIGVRAARAAGVGHVVGVGPRALDSDADVVVHDLRHVTWTGDGLDIPAEAVLRAPEQPELLFLPTHLRNVPYVYDRAPAAVAPGDVSGGANCQVFAYAVLGHFGRHVPALHSSDLWAETEALKTVEQPAPFDLMLFDPGRYPGRPEGYAAHIAVYLGPDRILHLCKEIGQPVIWTRADFAARPRYARLLGLKRVRPPGAA